MQQTCSSNIVSLHVYDCKHGCPHSDVCYLRKRKLSQGHPLPSTFRRDMLEAGYTIHESLCTPIRGWMKTLLQKFKNYNITLSYMTLKASKISIKDVEKQVQVSVYNEKQAREVKCQKLFLVKDLDTFRTATQLAVLPGMRNLHFNITQNFNNIQLLTLHNDSKNISLDSCMYSWIVNGECPYTTTYVDISHDWTLRKCPFSVEGVPIPKNFINKKRDNYHELFSLKHKPEVCCYAKRFQNKG